MQKILSTIWESIKIKVKFYLIQGENIDLNNWTLA
jgi:hypothetical protein